MLHAGFFIVTTVTNVLTFLAIVGCAFHGQKNAKDDEKADKKPFTMPDLTKEADKSIMRTRSSYGPELPPALGEDNTLEENTEMNRERVVDVARILDSGTVSSTSIERDSSQTSDSSEARGEHSTHTADSFPHMYLLWR
ncbi:hypothetical protein V1264_022870 [Littorina saxatilis]|uniref:Uncharacterized protein n=1 Tax=Littorina saxatilis TaxID=31220 RepID=A0AAN9B5U1_9CAEN